MSYTQAVVGVGAGRLRQGNAVGSSDCTRNRSGLDAPRRPSLELAGAITCASGQKIVSKPVPHPAIRSAVIRPVREGCNRSLASPRSLRTRPEFALSARLCPLGYDAQTEAMCESDNRPDNSHAVFGTDQLTGERLIHLLICCATLQFAGASLWSRAPVLRCEPFWRAWAKG